MPLILKSCDQNGNDSKNRLMLVYASGFTQTAESIQEIFKRVSRGGPANDCYEKIITNCAIAFLEQFSAEIKHLSPEYQRIAQQRLDFAGWTTDKLWSELFSFSSGVAGKYVNEFDFTYGEYIIKELATRPDLSLEEIFNSLNRKFPEGYNGYDDVYLSVLAGELRLKEAIPFLLDNVRIDGDLICEIAVDALAKIGTEEVVREVRECFLKEPWHFRLFAQDVLGRIKLPACEEALIEILPWEEEIDIATALADCLCRLLSVKGIPMVKKFIDEGYERSLLSLEESLYINCIINGIDMPELKKWKQAIEEEEKRISPVDSIFMDKKELADECGPVSADTWIGQKPIVSGPKIGRNEPCPCGSGKKYKKCCMNLIADQPADIDDKTIRKIDKLIQQGYSRLWEDNDSCGACFRWLSAWEELKRVITSRKIADVAALHRLIPCQEFISNWCQDLEMELGNAGIDDLSYMERRIAYTREFVQLLPASDKLIIQNMRRATAESYYDLGDKENGEITFRKLIEDYPDWAWGYIGWGDMFWLSGTSKTSPDYKRARSIYESGLESCVDEVSVIKERLQDLAEKEHEGD
jgi:hypothetical protein